MKINLKYISLTVLQNYLEKFGLSGKSAKERANFYVDFDTSVLKNFRNFLKNLWNPAASSTRTPNFPL